MRQDIDWLVADERVRKAYEEKHRKHISYGKFREFHSELVPSQHKKDPEVVRSAKNYDKPHRKGGTFQMQLSKDDDEQLAEQFKSGKSEHELAVEFNVTVQTVRLHLKKMKLYTAKRAPRDWTDKELETLKTLYFRDESLGYIAEMLNRSLNSVRAKIASTGLQKLKTKMKSRCETATSSAASKNSLN